MTPKEKAEELIAKYSIMVNVSFIEHSIPTVIRGLMLRKSAIQCALIAVDEIILSQFQFDMISIYGTPFNHFWQEVKKELEAL